MDTNPRMPAAGIGHVGDQESAAYCVQPDLDPRRSSNPSSALSTDPAQARWRTSYRREPGQRFIHAGLVGAPLLPPEYRHGIRTAGGDKAGDVFATHGAPQSDLGAYHTAAKESIYRSHIREPLGSGYIRGHALPARTLDEDFRFGVSTSESESAKNLLYHPTAPPHVRSHGALDMSGLNYSPDEYARTLGSTTSSRAANESMSATMSRTAHAGATIAGAGMGAGTAGLGPDPHSAERLITRPINREYNWDRAGINPSIHRFGKVSNVVPSGGFEGGVAAALKQGATKDATTNIGSKRVEEAKSNTFDHLGKGRRQRGALAGDPSDPSSTSSGDRLNYTGHRGRTFGRPGGHDEWGARDCIRGTYSEREQMPDADLARSSFKVTALEFVPANHAERSFGLPSIRADRAPPKMKSVANDMNFGDESNGKGLLYPSQFSYEGINEEDFLARRTPAQVRAVFETLGVRVEDAVFERVVALAVERYGALSVDSFRHAFNQVRLGIVCEGCGASLCQHDDCKTLPCRHNEHANHALHARHLKQDAPQQIKAAGFSSNTHPAM